jgi:hypothetical protein
VLALALGAWGAGCDDEQSAPQDGGTARAGDGGGAGEPGTFYPVASPSDPCAVAGYYFDGESDCDVVRCPELTCECEPEEPAQPGAEPPPARELRLSACVPAIGCLSLVDCNRVCNPKARLTRDACEQRMRAAGAQHCQSDADCVAGSCREESVGSICVDTLACAEDGHCGTGSACLFDPEALDPKTKLPTMLGTCADGRGDSRCYDDGDCVYGHCQNQRCTAGAIGDACAADGNCASGFCRMTGSMPPSGNCVSGAQGGACFDDADCMDGLHCTGNVCFTDAVGQHCERDDQCASATCIAGRCRGGESGSPCMDDGDCEEGVCAGFVCASGALLSPCYEATDCRAGLVCARQLCSDGAKGSPCASDADCSVLACVNGACSDGADGAVCEMDDDCTSQRCANPAGIEPGECTSGAPGAVCIYAGHCLSNQCAYNGICN